MKIEYSLQNEDFLDYQLFNYTKSAKLNKRRRKSWILFSVCFLLFAVSAHLRSNEIQALLFLILCLICILFYPKYIKWRYKKHYLNFIKDNYQARIGKTESLDFQEKIIHSKSATGEGKIYLTEIENIYEIPRIFIMSIKSGMSIIIPKKYISDLNQLKKKFTDLKLKVDENLDWKWK
tara:strand:- start:520 stop:1053 length:534 start_codon:yes stop_codon:yes gene_type:complete